MIKRTPTACEPSETLVSLIHYMYITCTCNVHVMYITCTCRCVISDNLLLVSYITCTCRCVISGKRITGQRFPVIYTYNTCTMHVHKCTIHMYMYKVCIKLPLSVCDLGVAKAHRNRGGKRGDSPQCGSQAC